MRVRRASDFIMTPTLSYSLQVFWAKAFTSFARYTGFQLMIFFSKTFTFSVVMSVSQWNSKSCDMVYLSSFLSLPYHSIKSKMYAKAKN